MTPLLDERLEMAPEDRPVRFVSHWLLAIPTHSYQNDLLTWLLAEAPKHPGEMRYEALAHRMLVVNFAAIHTTSMVCPTSLVNIRAAAK